MTRTHRTVMALILAALLVSAPTRLTQAQGGAPQENSRKTFTIVGRVGVAGVNMKGLPGDPITDENGAYSAWVESGWKGLVTPTKEGYSFKPPTRQYDRVADDLKDENYVASVITFPLSGNVGVARVRLAGLPGEVMSISDGYYLVRLPYGWTGVIEPMKDGYSFTPTNRAIEQLTQDRSGIDFIARTRMMTITDQILLGDEPVPGVRITAKPGDYSATTDARGRYTIRVPYGWTGELFLAKEGFEFSPPSIYYDNVTEDVDLVGSGPVTAPPRTVLPTVAPPESTGDVLIIPTTEVAPGEFAQIAEDMRVMLHILHENLSVPRMISGVLYDFGDFFRDSDRSVEALYIQGYGAVFMMQVDFPLSVPAQGQGRDAQAEQQAVDPVWQRARDRLYAPPGATPWWSHSGPSEADARNVDQFKQDLIGSLRHAANIRNIEPNEWVIVTVTGRNGTASGGGFGGGMGGMGGGMMGGGMGGYGGTGGGMAGGYGGMMGGVSGYGGGGGSFGGSAGGSFHVNARSRSGGSVARHSVEPAQAAAPTTVLTIQARKADIDALAGGQTDLEQFRQKVKVFMY